MIRLSLIAAASALILGACTTSPTTPDPAAETVVVPSSYELGLQTATELKEAGNVPVAIQRLMQVAGDPDITSEQKARVLYEMATLSMGKGGYDLTAGVGYLDEIILNHPDTEFAGKASKLLPGANARVEELNAVLASADSTQTQKFYALMELGRHLDAIDLMTSYSLETDNEVKLAMYQIGYLCDEAGLTGQTYTVTDRDGTSRSLRFCDYGK